MADNGATGGEQPVALGEAFREFVETLKAEKRAAHSVYVRKYIEHVGADTVSTALTSSKVELYAEQNIKASDPNAAERVEALKAWFQFLRKKNYVGQNYGVNIRVRRSSGSGRGAPGTQVRLEQAPVEMTAEGIEALKRELDELNARVPELVAEVAKAREDKDFRENSPLEAAREALAFNQARRQQIEATLKRAVVVDRGQDDRSAVGSTVTVTRLDTNQQQTFKLVGPREANAREQKISVESPVGAKLLGRRPGEEVEVQVPSGTIEFRIDAVQQG